MNHEDIEEIQEEIASLHEAVENQQFAIEVIDELLTAFTIALKDDVFSSRAAAGWMDKVVMEWNLKRRPQRGQAYRLLTRWQEDLHSHVDPSEIYEHVSDACLPARPALRLVHPAMPADASTSHQAVSADELQPPHSSPSHTVESPQKSQGEANDKDHDI